MESEYESVRMGCLESGDLWTDPDFPAVQSSLFAHGKHQLNIVWKRPKVNKRTIKIKIDAW